METPRRPPSGTQARVWTVAALFMPVLLPMALVYQRRAFTEATGSGGRWVWRRSLINRPLLLYAVVWAGFFATTFLLMVLFAALGVSPV